MAKKAVIKTQETKASVDTFISKVPDEQKRKDSYVLVKMMEKASKSKAKMWGSAIIGFGNIVYKSPSGREVDWMKIGFSPRKANLTLYLMMNKEKQAAGLKKLGKHKTNGGCIYINKLADIDLKVLEGMIKEALSKK